MSNVDINVDRRTDGRTDGRTENRTPILHPATSRCDKKDKQDLSADRIARLILHILFLENSYKPVTLILT